MHYVLIVAIEFAIAFLGVAMLIRPVRTSVIMCSLIVW